MIEGKFLELGIATIIVIMLLREILPYLTKTGNGQSVMKSQIDDIARQMDKMVLMWSPERAKQMSETHTLAKETLDMHKVNREHDRELSKQKHKEQQERLKECVAEQKKTNTYLERLITLSTVGVDPWNPPK